MNPFELVTDPHLVHGVVVHFPVALGILGIPLVVISSIVGKNATLRWTACVLYLLLAAVSFGAVMTGEGALASLVGRLAPEARALADRHVMLAKGIWIPAVVTAMLILLCGAKSERLRGALAVLAILASVVTGIWIGAASCYGAAMVYKYGVGAETPSPIVPIVPAPLSPTRVPTPTPAPTAAQPAPPAATPPAGSAVAPSAARPLMQHNPARHPAPPTTVQPPSEESYLQSIASYWKGVARKVWYGK